MELALFVLSLVNIISPDRIRIPEAHKRCAAMGRGTAHDDPTTYLPRMIPAQHITSHDMVGEANKAVPTNQFHGACLIENFCVLNFK